MLLKSGYVAVHVPRVKQHIYTVTKKEVKDQDKDDSPLFEASESDESSSSDSEPSNSENSEGLDSAFRLD